MLPEGTIITPGQELAEEVGYSIVEYRIVKVEKITPSGRIVLTNKRTFETDGRERTKAMRRSQLSLLTPEIREKIERANNLRYVNTCAWNNVDNETLRAVVALLKQAKGEA